MAFNTDTIQSAGSVVKVSGTDTTAGYLLDKILAGSNVSISHDNIGGNETLTINASGSGGGSMTKLAATGALAQTAFTFISKPTVIVSDGASYEENKGWTWNGGTLTATMSIAPTYDIYGLS